MTDSQVRAFVNAKERIEEIVVGDLSPASVSYTAARLANGGGRAVAGNDDARDRVRNGLDESFDAQRRRHIGPPRPRVGFRKHSLVTMFDSSLPSPWMTRGVPWLSSLEEEQRRAPGAGFVAGATPRREGRSLCTHMIGLVRPAVHGPPRVDPTGVASPIPGRGYPLDTGNSTRIVAPLPGSLVAEMAPPCAVTMAWQMASPRPIPWPTPRVVKNGSNM